MSQDSGCSGVVRRVVPLLLALLVLLGQGIRVAAPASAEDAAGPVRVTITAVTPSSPRPDQTLTISGTVTNTSSKPVTSVQVHLWRSTDAVTDAAALGEVLASAPDNPLGRRMVTVTDGNVFNITDVGATRSQAFPGGRASFDPGQTARFTVTGKLSGSTGMGLTDGTYLTGVQVRGVPAGQANQTVGRARALVVVASAAATVSSPQTVVLLNSRPSLAGGSTFTDTHLATELRGRLATLLALARQPGTTLLVDPELLDELAVMSRGFRVRGTSQGTAQDAVRARGQQDAKDFLAALEPLLSSGRAYRSLYGSPDVRLAVAAGHPGVITASAQAPRGSLVEKLPLAVLPAGGVVDAESLDLLRDLHPAVVLAGNLAQHAPVQSVDGVTLVRVAGDAYDGGPGPRPSTQPAQVTGRLQAQQRLVGSLTTVASTTQQAEAELAAAPWRTRTPLPALLEQHRAVAGQVVAPAAVGPQDTLSAALDRTRDDLLAWGELVGRQAEAKVLLTQVLPSALSTAWGGDETAAGGWLGAVRTQRGAVLSSDRVRLRAVRNIVTSAAVQDIPVTITNGLSSPVKVRLTFDSENAQRIRIDDTSDITVAAGDSETVKVRVTSSANGVVGVQARLTTSTGRQVGSPQTITITATQAGRVGWIIIIASGVVLMAGTTMRIRQVQRERRLSSATAQAAHWSSTGPSQE